MKKSFVSIQSRPGVKQNFMLIEPEFSFACVILFAGGSGVLGISKKGDRILFKRDINFLVRSRNDFATHGLDVAVLDAPSDRNGDHGMMAGFRNSLDHVTDVQAIIDYLSCRNNKPIWLIGTSRGTESVAYNSIHGKKTIAGIVFTSSITVTDRHGVSITELNLEQIQVPAQVLSHIDDGCYLTPPIGTHLIARKLVNAPKIDVGFFEGGRNPVSQPCDPLSEHGFFGIEPIVVARIAKFILSSIA